MNDWKAILMCAALWGGALFTLSSKATADCAVPTETMDLELESVSLDGVPVDDLGPFETTGTIIAWDVTYIEVHLGERVEWFDHEAVAP